MTDIEIPTGKRSKTYRFFEMLPAILSYGAVVLLVVLSLVNPLLAAVYLILFIITLLVKAVGIAFRTIQGHKILAAAREVGWSHRLADLENPAQSLKRVQETTGWRSEAHTANLHAAAAETDYYPKPSELYNAVFVAAYNEGLEVLEPTMQSILDTDYDNKHIILVLAYEERGGEQMRETAATLKEKYGDRFKAFLTVEHPKNLPREVIGKGGNITHAGRYLKQWLQEQEISYDRVIVTTLDSDNRPHKAYFSYVTYEYIVNPKRLKISFQPISLYTNNIWDVPAPMRVLATGNSFWHLIVSLRPHMLRNFASHSQGMAALVEMDFWSVRTIVEDGHQYWRSYFFFDGDYEVVPIHVPIYQDAVLSDTYYRTLKAQFVQLRRWAYGASDVAYVASNLLRRDRKVPIFGGIARFVRLLDSHVTWACAPLMVAFGAWVPLLLNQEAARNIVAHELPVIVSRIQQVAMFGLFVSMFWSFKLLPRRPARYKRRRTLWMVAQWALMPIVSIVYTSASGYYSQTRLFLGKYLDKFDVTKKAIKK